MNKAIIEEWRDAVGYEGLYMVSSFGRIKSLYGWNGRRYIKRERILKPTIKKQGNYQIYVVTLTKVKSRTCRVHQLVAKAFLDNPQEYKSVNHKDFNPLNNHVDNLEWCTHYQNIKWSADNWRMITIKKDCALKISYEYHNGLSAKKIADKYKIKDYQVYSVLKKLGVKRRTHGEAMDKYGIDLNMLLIDFKKQYTNKDIQKKYKCSKEIIATRKYQFKKAGLL